MAYYQILLWIQEYEISESVKVPAHFATEH